MKRKYLPPTSLGNVLRGETQREKWNGTHKLFNLIAIVELMVNSYWKQ